MQEYRMSEQPNTNLAEIRSENEGFPTFMIMQPNESMQPGDNLETKEETTEDNCNCWSCCKSTFLILMTLYYALAFFGGMVTCMVLTYNQDHIHLDFIHYYAIYGVIGCYYGYVVFQNTPETYGYAASLHFFMSSLFISAAYIFFYCSLMKIEFIFMNHASNHHVNDTNNMPQNKDDNSESHHSFMYVIACSLIGNGVFTFLTALAYYKCGSEPSTEEINNEEQRLQAVNLDAPHNDLKNEKSTEAKATAVMVSISLVLALIHFILFGMLVRDGGNRFHRIKFPQVVYYLLVGTLGFYSIYIVCMQSIQVYRNAACIHTGLSMVAFSFSFISLFHSFVKLTGTFMDKNTTEGIEYLIYGILAIFLGFMYAAVAYLYEDYDPQTGSSIINQFLNPDVNQSPYENFDASKFHKNEGFEAVQIPALNHL